MIRNRFAAAALATGAALLLAAPAAAADHQPEPGKGKHTPKTRLILMTQGVHDTDEVDFAYLTCEPIGGSHPRPDESCMTLEEVDGRFDRLPGESGICTKQYDPVIVRAYGHWQNRFVHWSSREYGNRCEANLATNRVFDY